MSCGSSQNLLTSVVERTPKIEKVNVDGGRYIREAKVTIIRSTSFNVGWISFMEYSNYKKVYFFMALYIWTCFFLHSLFVQSGMSNQLVVVKIFHKTFMSMEISTCFMKGMNVKNWRKLESSVLSRFWFLFLGLQILFVYQRCFDSHKCTIAFALTLMLTIFTNQCFYSFNRFCLLIIWMRDVWYVC